jgi:hypothetical protein
MPSRSETALLLVFLLLLALALAGPSLAHPAPHGYADQRVLWGVPNAMDALSNLPFAMAGLAGAWLLWRLPAEGPGLVQRALAGLFCAGLVLTAAGSAWYHLQPDDARLALDRFAMSMAFAGLLGLAAAGTVSDRAGAALGLAVLLLGPLAVLAWSRGGNVLPWAVVQFGGMVLLLAFALVQSRPTALQPRWAWVLAAYALAKLFEAQDHAVYALSGQTVSGHTLKHLIAALAALPVLLALRRGARSAAHERTSHSRTQAYRSRRV